MVVRGRARSCAVVRGRARSCAVVRGRARSCAVVRGRARSCVVVRGRAWSSLTAVLPFCTDGRTHGHTDGQHIIPPKPLWGGVGQFFYHIKVRVSIRTCVPNVGSIRGSVRKNCLLSLIIDLSFVLPIFFFCISNL